MGTFSCCQHDHIKVGADGEHYTTACDKLTLGPNLLKMLDKRREFHLGFEQMLLYRAWTAFTHPMMQGFETVTSDDLPVPSSVDEFLCLMRFNGARDEENQGSGITPLMLSAIAGNLVVVEALVNLGVDVNARTIEALAEFSAHQGSTALLFAAAVCPGRQTHGVVAALLQAGADPNSQTVFGGTPLMAAAFCQHLDGMNALISCATEKLDLEIKLYVNASTALGLAAFTGSTECVEALLAAGANRHHLNDHGSSILSVACQNSFADPRMLELICGHTHSWAGEINYQVKPRTARWRAIDMLAIALVRHGISRTHRIMGIAHSQGLLVCRAPAFAAHSCTLIWCCSIA